MQCSIPSRRGFSCITGTEYIVVGQAAQHCQMLNGLMGRAILANADAVMCQNTDYGQTHQCFHSQPCLHVVCEYKEACNIRSYAPMHRHTVCDCCHRKFADTEMHIRACGVFLAVIFSVLHLGFIGGCKVSRAAKQVRHYLCHLLQHLLGCRSGCKVALVLPEVLVIE